MTTGADIPPTDERESRPADRRLDQIVFACLLFAIGVFVAVRLGPSLLGFRVFAGMDVLRLSEPYSFPDNHPVRSFVYVTDQIDGLFPSLHEARTAVLHGRFPRWSNLVSGGQPLLGEPSLGVFTPSRILYLLLPVDLAAGWVKLVELLFSGWFTFLLVRRLDGSRLAAVLGGAIYPLTGFMIGWNNYPQVAVAASIPMLFWATERFVQSPRWPSLLPISCAAALLMLGGFPAVSGQAFYVCSAYFLVRLVARGGASWPRLAGRALAAGAALAVGVGVSAFQLIPFAHSVIGGTDLTYRSRQFFQTSPKLALGTTVLPRSFSTNSLCCTASPQDVNTYIGALVLFLVLLGMIAAVVGRFDRSAGAYFALVVLSVVVLVWFQGWWTSWLNSLPVWHANPIGRFRSQLGLPIAVLAAFGLDFLAVHVWALRWRRFRGPWLVTGVAMVVAAGVGLMGLHLVHHGNPFVTLTVERDVVVAAVPVVVVGLLALVARRPALRAAMVALVCVGVVAQGFVATGFYWPTTSRDRFYPTDAAIRFLQKNQGSSRIATTGYTLRVNVSSYYGLRTLNGHAFVDPKWKSVILGIDPSAQLGPTYTAFTANVGQILGSPGFDRMGVKYLVAGVDDVGPGYTPVQIPGRADPALPTSGQTTLVPGRTYSSTVPAGPLRGVLVPVRSTRPAIVTVTVRNQAGEVVATDQRRVPAPQNVELPVPLAEGTGGTAGTTPSNGPLMVELRVDGPGVSVSTAAGQPAVRAVRPPVVPDGLRVAFAGDGVVVWQRLNALPRIRWASSSTVVANSASRLSAVVSGPVVPGQVILSGAPSAPAVAAPGAAAPTGTVRIVHSTGDRTEVKVTAQRSGYVVMSDSIQNNFDASVDGHSRPIVDADYAGGAVYVPAGTHTVVIRYHAKGQTEGNLITTVCLLLLAGGAIAAVELRRRRRPGGQHRRSGPGNPGSLESTAEPAG